MRWVISWDIVLIHKNIPETNAGRCELAKEIVIWLNKVCQYMLDPNWNGNGKFALIGDALHAMALYYGEGLNHAMIDVAKLGEQLVKAHRDEITLAEAITASV
ncbi:hypothetical protein INT44_002655 [Umbelopsis vinacea]|uniref:FAD-binding domain-containing protein n=1 Tax=Umbelopsis vinacea TaxID=44442 RepID=A0A8H7U835_9FUNG|nr:hypothetical protein INT44_002655 [Umbelopsis vinacea]